MKASKAIKKTFKSQVKILVTNGIQLIKDECNKGNYRAKIDLLVDKSTLSYRINEQVKNTFESLGYKLGSTNSCDNRYYLNVFWDIEELNKEDFISS